MKTGNILILGQEDLINQKDGVSCFNFKNNVVKDTYDADVIMYVDNNKTLIIKNKDGKQGIVSDKDKCENSETDKFFVKVIFGFVIIISTITFCIYQLLKS